MIILGKHIHLTDQVYQGTGNTIDSYHRYDLAEGLLFACCIYIGILLCERMIKKRPIEIKGVSGERIPLGKITVSSIVLMLLWSPYLYVYYPGFIFGDSTANIAQALGQQPLTNHHPVAYVLFIRLCLRLGQHLGGLTMGPCNLFCDTDGNYGSGNWIDGSMDTDAISIEPMAYLADACSLWMFAIYCSVFDCYLERPDFLSYNCLRHNLVI